MALETIFQHEIFTKFILPFLLMFVIVFAILEKTKILGSDKKQLDAIIAFVIGLIFVSVVSPKMIVENLILFLTVALVIIFVVLLLWGFVSGGEAKIGGKGIKIAVGVLIVLSVLIAVLVITGIYDNVFNFLFKQSWSNSFWTNVAFIAVIAIALALILNKKASS